MLKNSFFNLTKIHSPDTHLIDELWKEIEENYSNKKRHYHTLSHLDNLLKQLSEVKDKIESWETIMFTLFYHDIIYNALKSDNEEKSAELAEKRMSQINVPSHIIENCKLQILATKKHLSDQSSDANYFLDADLSVLGQDIETYTLYYQNVRKEYAIYPDIIYKPGRKKVLKHFLGMDRIYKTEYFHTKLESQAKYNLSTELGLLS